MISAGSLLSPYIFVPAALTWTTLSKNYSFSFTFRIKISNRKNIAVTKILRATGARATGVTSALKIIFSFFLPENNLRKTPTPQGGTEKNPIHGGQQVISIATGTAFPVVWYGRLHSSILRHLLLELDAIAQSSPVWQLFQAVLPQTCSGIKRVLRGTSDRHALCFQVD